MTSRDYIVFGRPRFTEEEVAAVASTFRTGWVGTGPRVKEFQSKFAEYVGAPYAVAVGSGTAALHLTMLAAGLREGDEVITTPLTFAATANAILHARAVPVFADVQRDTMNIDPEQVEEKITGRTKAIIAVHLAGRPCDMDSLQSLAKRYDLLLFDDAAHAIETQYKGRKVGELADASCFSFYVTKNITTIEGGMICTRRADMAERARVLSLHGMTADAWKRFMDVGYQHYDVVLNGFKYNMTDVQATVGIGQLARIEQWLDRRRAIWARYDAAFADLPCTLPAPEEKDTVHARHLYTLLVDEASAGISRDRMLTALHEASIGCGVHYRSLHRQPYYRKRYGYRADDFPNADYIGERTLSIPMSPHLTDDEVGRVIEAVQQTLRRAR